MPSVEFDRKGNRVKEYTQIRGPVARLAAPAGPAANPQNR